MVRGISGSYIVSKRYGVSHISHFSVSLFRCLSHSRRHSWCMYRIDPRHLQGCSNGWLAEASPRQILQTSIRKISPSLKKGSGRTLACFWADGMNCCDPLGQTKTQQVTKSQTFRQVKQITDPPPILGLIEISALFCKFKHVMSSTLNGTNVM